MRYYGIKVDGAPGVFPARYDNGCQWGTLINGQYDPGAQQIEFQIEEWTPNTFSENSVLTIYGVSFDQIKHSRELVGKPITIYGGMSPGLPLASYQSQRDKLLLQGEILKCWGNWIGTETSIGMSFVSAGGTTDSGSDQAPAPSSSTDTSSSAPAPAPTSLRVARTGFRSIDRRFSNRILAGPVQFASVGSLGFSSEAGIGPATSSFGGIASSFFGGGGLSPLSAPLNIIHNLLPNIHMGDAIKQTLSKVFPKAKQNIQISPNLKLPYQDAGMYQSMEQYTQYLQKLSQSIMGTNKYPGVNFSSFNNTINVWDKPIGNTEISYFDLVGQPTWLTINTISVKVVLRGGLHVGYEITLPQTLVNYAGPDSAAPIGMPDQRTQVSLPGGYTVTKILHIGDFRNPDGASWTTNIEAATSASMGVDSQSQAASIAQGGTP